MLICPKCGSEIPDVEEKCPTCRFSAGPPNVRIAERAEEVLALEERYQRAFDSAKAKGCSSILGRFDEAAKRTSAVINLRLNFLHFFVTNGIALYLNYERGVSGRSRKPAALFDDLARRGVGGTLFGSYADEINYAALSMDGSGLDSYGPYSIRLRDIAVQDRATVLENNSYHFRKKYNIAPGDRPPLGYSANWSNRHKLAVAKLEEYITTSTQEADFPSLLLSSAGDRATDEFIEVQIYDTFDLNAVESVKGSSKGGSRDDQDLLRMVKEHLKNLGKPWIEV